MPGEFNSSKPRSPSLQMRTLQDEDNQRLLDRIGLHHDRGNLLRSCINRKWSRPRTGRAIAVHRIARDTGQYAKNDRGAEAYAAFASVIRTAMKTALLPSCLPYRSSLDPTNVQILFPDQRPLLSNTVVTAGDCADWLRTQAP